jgi:hypothetical protein
MGINHYDVPQDDIKNLLLALKTKKITIEA